MAAFEPSELRSSAQASRCVLDAATSRRKHERAAGSNHTAFCVCHALMDRSALSIIECL